MRGASAWRELPAENRNWLLTRALLATAAINVVVNAAIAWLGVAGQGEVRMWGVPLVETSIFWNVVGTLFLLPLITCVLTTTAIRRDIRRGALPPLARLRSMPHWLADLPLSRWRRGVVAGALAVAVLAPPLVLALLAVGPGELGEGQFVLCQTVFAVLLGTVVTPPLALCAMTDPPSAR
ncbi:MAG TPA: hypothetical protein VG898_11725 [Solirubrobacterales bacterium]|nr:hypothetical protein [Solirubrobacterales bacterium]